MSGYTRPDTGRPNTGYRPGDGPGGNRPGDNRPGDNRPGDRDDRLDQRRDNLKDRGEYYQDRRNEQQEFYEDRWKYVVGGSVSSAHYWSLSCTRTTVVVGSVTYHECGSTWYQRHYVGGNTTFVVVNAPAGH
jgi:hypothetical protein